MEFRLTSNLETNLGSRLTYMSDDGRYKVVKVVGYTKDQPHRKVAWLIITPQGETPLHDWRDMQTIKNVLCGPEAFGIEIYPPESHLVDTNNSFHLWVYLDGFRPQLGFFNGRNIVDPQLNKIQMPTLQRTFTVAPPDARSSTEAIRKHMEADPALLSEKEVEAKNRIKNKRKR